MGSEFAIVFDIAIAAIIILMFFEGWRKGFAKKILGLAAIFVAFAAGMTFSGPIAEGIYGGYIEKPASEALDGSIDASFSAIHLKGVSDVDFSKVKISGVSVGEITPDYRGTNSASVDLSVLDLSEIGLTDEDLETLGIEDDVDLSAVNAKTASFTEEEIIKYGLGKLAVSQYAAICLIQKNEFDNFNRCFEIVDKYIPGGINYGSSDNITVSAVRKLTLSMLETKSSLKDTLLNGIIRPNCIIIIRTIAFVLIFALVNTAIRLIANLTKIIDKIPVLGKVNSFLGGIAGLCEGLVIVFIICLATRLAVSLSNGDAIMFNQATINSTYLFRRFYETDFLNFLI